MLTLSNGRTIHSSAIIAQDIESPATHIDSTGWLTIVVDTQLDGHAHEDRIQISPHAMQALRYLLAMTPVLAE